MGKPRIAVHKFSSCDGCQLQILNLEEELLDIVGAVDIVYFLEARSYREPGPYDVSFVEGSVSTSEEVERIKEVREDSKFLVAIGACATAGGLQALRNWVPNFRDFAASVYPHPEYLKSLEKATPISEHVQVDLSLQGCPVDRKQVLEVIVSLLLGRKPFIPTHSVCIECKRKGNICVMVAMNIPCLGPVTQAGCGAICPSFGRGCYGCFGPMDSPNPDSLASEFEKRGMGKEEVIREFRKMTGWSSAFREITERIEKEG